MTVIADQGPCPQSHPPQSQSCVFSITAVHEEECRPELEEKKPASDHPLSLLKESKWKKSFDDRDLWNLIEKDTVRTKPKCKFLQEEYEL